MKLYTINTKLKYLYKNIKLFTKLNKKIFIR